MEKQYTKGELIFFTGYIVYIVATTFGYTKLAQESTMYGIIHLLPIFASLFVLVKVFFEQEATRGEMIFYILLVLLGIVTYFHSGKIEFFCAVCLIMAITDISIYTVMKISVIVQLIVMAVTAVALQSGWVESLQRGAIVWNETVISEKDTLLRYDLGYSHPNIISGIVFFTSLSYMCIRKKCYFLEMLMLFLVNYLVYQETGSRTCFILIIVFIPLLYLFKKKRRIQGYWKILLMVSPIVTAGAALLAQVFYQPTNVFLYELNTVLSNRIQLGNAAFYDYGVKLFGQNITYVAEPNFAIGESYNFVDCSYMRILLDYGLIAFIVVMIMCILVMKRLAEENEPAFCIAFLAILVFAMIEPNMLWGGEQIFFLLMGQWSKYDCCEILLKQKSII